MKLSPLLVLCVLFAVASYVIPLLVIVSSFALIGYVVLEIVNHKDNADLAELRALYEKVDRDLKSQQNKLGQILVARN